MGGAASRRRRERQLIAQAMRDSMREANLPHGWEEAYTEDGKKYFINHGKQRTTFADPRTSRLSSASFIGGRPPKYSNDTRSKLSTLQVGLKDDGDLQLMISRENLFEESVAAVMNVDPWQLKQQLQIGFIGEEGLDHGGGMSREWVLLLSQELVDPKYGLLEKVAEDRYEYQFVAKDENLGLCAFLGRLFALSLTQAKVLDVPLIETYYSMLLCKPVGINELSRIEPDFYRNLKWMLDTAIDGLCLGLTFTVTHNGQDIPLKEGGAHIELCDENKQEYVDLAVEFKLRGRAAPQFQAFSEAFFSVVPEKNVSTFDAQELESMLMGSRDIDVEDWRKNTAYQSGLSEYSEVVLAFWELLISMPNEERRAVLQFCTGTSKTPVGGFSALSPQQFTITAKDKHTGLPTAHTCFNRLELPMYNNPTQELPRAIKVLMEVGVEGFGVQ